MCDFCYQKNVQKLNLSTYIEIFYKILKVIYFCDLINLEYQEISKISEDSNKVYYLLVKHII